MAKPRTARHGTRSRYYRESDPCRCTLCTEAVRAYAEQRRLKKGRPTRKNSMSKNQAKDIRTDLLGHTWMSSNGNFGAVEYDCMTLEQYRQVRA